MPVKTQQEENRMLVLVGYFFIAASAGFAASAIIGYILASMLIRRYEKADRPVKVLSTGATTIQHHPCAHGIELLPLDASDRQSTTGPQPHLKSTSQILGAV
jgi:hypothetical protein